MISVSLRWWFANTVKLKNTVSRENILIWTKGHGMPEIQMKHKHTRCCTVAATFGSYNKELQSFCCSYFVTFIAWLTGHFIRHNVQFIMNKQQINPLHVGNTMSTCWSSQPLLVCWMGQERCWNGFERGMVVCGSVCVSQTADRIAVISEAYRNSPKNIQWAPAAWKEMPCWSQGSQVRVGSLSWKKDNSTWNNHWLKAETGELTVWTHMNFNRHLYNSAVSGLLMRQPEVTRCTWESERGIILSYVSIYLVFELLYYF